MLNDAYLWLPHHLQTLAVSALGLRNRAKRYGSSFRRHEIFLGHSECWCEERLRQWQQEQLTKLLDHAFDTVPHFRSQRPKRTGLTSDGPEVLAALPLLEKSEMRGAPRRFVSEGFRSKDLLSVRTTGTTGSPMTFVVDRVSRQRHYAFFTRHLNWASLDAKGWHAVFMGRVLGREEQLRRQPWRIDYANRRVYYSSYHISDDTIARYAQHMADRRYEWIEGYPSAIGNVARLAHAHGLDILAPRAIIPSSETLDGGTRKEIERYFGDIIREFYTAAEQAVFISQCEAGSLHINPEYGIVELQAWGKDQDGVALYEMVATSFHNWAMPLIRYRTGDLITTAESDCPCGRAFPRVGRIAGRTSAALVLPDGRRVTGISNVPKGLPIERSQLVQISEALLEFRVVPVRAGWDSTVEGILLRRLRDRLGSSVKVSVRVVDEIKVGPGGKFALVKKL